MEPPIHLLSALFEQLGLEGTEIAIKDFIDSHGPLAGNIELHKADFWSSSQASFLQQVKNEDADWAGIVDQFDALLR
ncbi:MAG: DUF2789 domain-containing protein [Oceanospirillaceae bacterium]|nr:DUF2789 domain-containing protein [Oceanospirillaceae bacterium]